MWIGFIEKTKIKKNKKWRSEYCSIRKNKSHSSFKIYFPERWLRLIYQSIACWQFQFLLIIFRLTRYCTIQRDSGMTGLKRIFFLQEFANDYFDRHMTQIWIMYDLYRTWCRSRVTILGQKGYSCIQEYLRIPLCLVT